MKKVIVVCDRCKRSFEPADSCSVKWSKGDTVQARTFRTSVSAVRAGGGSDGPMKMRRLLDLCPECAEKLFSWLFEKGREDSDE